MVKFILIKSPDEWATTKQACRDELVVYLFFLPYIYISLYFHVLSTVLRTSSFYTSFCTRNVLATRPFIMPTCFPAWLLQGTQVTLNYGIIRCPYLYFPKLVSFVYVIMTQLIA